MGVGASKDCFPVARAFWESEAAGDTFNYPWEAAETYASMKCDDILKVIADRRDWHLRMAQEQLDLVAKYASGKMPESLKDMSDASGSANRHNFAANSLAIVLREAEKAA